MVNVRNLRFNALLIIILANLLWLFTLSFHKSYHSTYLKTSAKSYKSSSIVSEFSHLNPVQPPIIDEWSVNDYYYESSALEEFVINHLDDLGYNKPYPSICKMWRKDPSYVNVATEIQTYLDQLSEYETGIHQYQSTISNRSLLEDISKMYQDGRGTLSWEDATNQVCEPLRLLTNPLNTSLNLFSKSSQVGFMEALLPPMRHPLYCVKKKSLLNLEYIVHDFYTMCRNLKPTSRVILIDMGASLDFHGLHSSAPPVYLVSRFAKFGFHFDHIYAYEISPKDPKMVFSSLPNDWIHAYHWINVPVQSDKESFLNPLQMILHKFKEEDLVLVKLDIDTPWLETTLSNQLLEEEGNSGLTSLIDHFYFEHHVQTKEMRKAWKATKGTVKDSMTLFQSLRKNGIASHFWV